MNTPSRRFRHSVLLCVDPRMYRGGQTACEQMLASLQRGHTYLVTRVAGRRQAPRRREDPTPEDVVNDPMEEEA